METIENLKAEINCLRQDNESLRKTIDAKDQKQEVLRAENAELANMVQFLKGQIEAYQYCLNCRH